MPRVAYKPLDVVEPHDVVDAYRQRRVMLKQNGGQLLNIDRTLLHSPAWPPLGEVAGVAIETLQPNS